MGTLARITVRAVSEDAAARAFARGFARIRELDEKLSDYKPDSELNRLCRAGSMRVSGDLYRVLETAQQLSRATDGAFDVTLGAAIRLWRARTGNDIRRFEALSRCGWRHLELDRGVVTLGLRGMQLDLGGIAKGYAADEALEAISPLPALVAMSGDLGIGAGEWRVSAAGDTRTVTNCGVSTSGDESQFLLDGARYSHIVDPRTGIGLRDTKPVTVEAPNAMLADAWATALSVNPQLRTFPFLIWSAK